MVSALHIYSYFWSFNPSRRLLDEEIEAGLFVAEDGLAGGSSRRC